jgi:hypothetical protein
MTSLTCPLSLNLRILATTRLLVRNSDSAVRSAQSISNKAQRPSSHREIPVCARVSLKYPDQDQAASSRHPLNFPTPRKVNPDLNARTLQTFLRKTHAAHSGSEATKQSPLALRLKIIFGFQPERLHPFPCFGRRISELRLERPIEVFLVAETVAQGKFLDPL